MALDTQIFFLLNNLAGQSHLLDGVIKFFASDLAYILIALFILLVAFSKHPLKKKAEVFIVVGVSSIIARFGVAELIRFFYHRPRPFVTLHVHQLVTDSSWSFPSGHATFFFAMAMAIYLYDKKWGIGFFVAAALISVARVAAGVHYPSDILGGALIGALVAYLTFRATEHLIGKKIDPTY